MTKLTSELPRAFKRYIPVYDSEGKKYYVTEEEFWKLRDSVPQVDVVKIPEL